MNVKSRFYCLGVAALFFCGNASAAGQPLFLGKPATASRANAALLSIADQPTTQDLQLRRADASIVGPQTREIEIDLGSQRVTAVQSQAQSSSPGSTVWSGQILKSRQARNVGVREVANDENNFVILVRRGNGVTGSVRVDGQLYRIRPLSDGNHAVIHVDQAAMPADHPPSFKDAPQIEMNSPVSARIGTQVSPTLATATIRVQVAATTDAISSYGGDMRALVDLAIAETNQGYVNSGVDIKMELANYRTVDYNSVGFDTDLKRFRNTNDGFFDDIHASRDTNGADVNMLVIDDGSFCGLASSIGSTASTAFAAVYWDCATGNYSFGHEVGHLQSARHDPANDSTNTPYAYGHGYQNPAGKWRTIMAYNCPGGCPRLNYWSNPGVTYQGDPMGTVNRSDNHRVLENTKATVAAFRGGGTPPPPTGTQTYTNSADFPINDNATVSSPIAVSGRTGNAPTNASVSVNIVHTYRGDLKVDLVAPDGSVYVLSNRAGGSADNLVATYPLNLSSEVLNGTWNLRVNDNANIDTGFINSWSVTF